MAKEKKVKSKLRKTLEGIFVGVFLVLTAFSCFSLISSTISKKESGNEYAPTKVGSIYMPLIVLTDSMEPEIMTGSAIFIKEVSCEDIKKQFNEGKNVDLTFDDTFKSYAPLTYPTETQDFLTNYSVDGVARPKTNRTTEENPAAVRTLTHRLFYIQENENVAYGEGKYYFFVEGINTQSTHYGAEYQYQVFTENELYGQVTGSSAFVGAAYDFVKKPIGLIILLLIPSLYMILSSVYELIKIKDEDEEPATEASKDAGLGNLSEKDIKRLKEEMLNEIMNKGNNDEN